MATFVSSKITFGEWYRAPQVTTPIKNVVYLYRSIRCCRCCCRCCCCCQLMSFIVANEGMSLYEEEKSTTRLEDGA